MLIVGIYGNRTGDCNGDTGGLTINSVFGWCSHYGGYVCHKNGELMKPTKLWGESGRQQT